ncbi:hypothetical protein Zmor_011728, partial [Zophobas morio]
EKKSDFAYLSLKGKSVNFEPSELQPRKLEGFAVSNSTVFKIGFVTLINKNRIVIEDFHVEGTLDPSVHWILTNSSKVLEKNVLDWSKNDFKITDGIKNVERDGDIIVKSSEGYFQEAQYLALYSIIEKKVLVYIELQSNSKKGNSPLWSLKGMLLTKVSVYIPSHFSFRALFNFIGPGLLISIAYLDPGNLLADIQAGASFNYSLIWVLFCSTFLGFLLQILSARLGIVTGKHLALVCREKYGDRTFLTICLWLVSEIAVIASDIPEVVGSAFGLMLLLGTPLWLGVLVVSLNTFVFLGIQYFGIRKLEYLISFLISIIAGCFCFEALISPIEYGIAECPSESEWKSLLNCTNSTLCPPNYWLRYHFLKGAVVMPHNLFLHSALVLSRKIDRRNPEEVGWADFYSMLECSLAIGISCFINLAVTMVAASVYYPSKSNGYRVPPNLGEIGFLEAGSLLQSALGRSTFHFMSFDFFLKMLRKIAPVLFGVALLASGQSSTVTGTYAGQFVMEGFIDIKITAWLRNILTRCLTVIPSLLPFALIPLLKFTSSEKIMNVHKNSKAMKITCVVLAGIVLFANFAMIYSSVIVSLKASLLSGLATVVYFGCILYIACRPVSLGPAGSYSALNEATEILTESFGSSADSSSGT